MNIIKKIKLANKLLKLYITLKKHFEKHTISKQVKEQIEIIINALKKLKDLVPDCKTEYEEVENIIENGIK